MPLSTYIGLNSRELCASVGFDSKPNFLLKIVKFILWNHTTLTKNDRETHYGATLVTDARVNRPRYQSVVSLL